MASNIPIFVPHVGCPNNCAFCNQRSITGTASAPSLAEARETVEAYLSGGGEGEKTIAFFGGSFTGIDIDVQRGYLSLAREYLDKGLVDGIRLSTRPDYIDEKRLGLLEEYGVTNIELGAQSMNDEVLLRAGRGHSADDVRRASELILKRGFVLGLQMMTGLPLDTPERAKYTAESFAALGAREVRIYPTLVMKNTALADMLERGEYRPQSVEEAVSLGAELYAFFKGRGIKVLRIGLSDSAELKENCLAGPYHPAMGELVVGRRIRSMLENMVENGRLDVRAQKKYFSKIVGNGRCNAEYFKARGIAFSLKPTDGAAEVNGKYSLDLE